ncbi:MAG: hypothetical protein AAFU79_02070, partial [Myxococcota bacterium]
CLGSQAVLVPCAENRAALCAYMTAQLQAIGITRPVQEVFGREDDDIEEDDLLPVAEEGESLFGSFMRDVSWDNFRYADMELEALAERRPGHILMEVTTPTDLSPEGREKVHGYSVFLSGWDDHDGGLTDEESLILQANGLGAYTRHGLGYFI